MNRNTMRISHLFGATLFFLLCAVFLGIVSFTLFPPYGMDDCYITYRYAYNIFHHKQFVFNPGERVLGTTSPLYTLILTGLQIFSDNIPRMSNFISCMSASLAGFFLFLILKKDNLPLGIFCALNYPFILQDIGLETNFLMFLFVVAVYLFARENYLICSAVLGLCFLTRQDSALFIGTMVLMYWLKKRKLPLRECLLFIATIAPWFIFSYLYFGAFFPTSLQEKMGYADFMAYFVDAWGYLARYCDRYAFHLFSSVGRGISPLLIQFPFVSHTSAADSLAMLYLIFTLLSLIYYLKNNAQHHYTGMLLYLYPLLMIMTLSVIGPPPGHRWHLTAAVNFALLGQLYLFTTPLLSWLKKWHLSAPVSMRRSVLLIGLLCSYLLYFTILNAKDFYVASGDANRSFWFGARYHNYKNIGCFLRDEVSDGESVFVLEVGTMGYYSMKRMIDGAGLISPGYGNYHREGCWLLGIEREFSDYIVAWNIDIPYYEPVYNFQNIFGNTVVHKKLNNLPETSYPFSELLHNWRKWKEQRM